MSTPYDRDTETDNQMTGVRVAIVRSNTDPEALGRVKVEFPWRDADDQSHWARIATEMTGSGYGTFFLPEVGDEVLVNFENGDIHKPIVVGSLYSGNRKPPAANATGNNDIRKITTRSGHIIEFDDNSDKGSVTIETNAGHKIVLDDESGNESVSIEDKSGNTIEMDATSNNISIDAANEISLNASKISLSADTKVDISSSGTLGVSANQQANFESKGMLNIDSNGQMGISSTSPLTIRGAIIKLN
jgi:uncharacterized protein involved in type VI secretion and phage assembly